MNSVTKLEQHRGYFCNRLLPQGDSSASRDQRRERALSYSWEKANLEGKATEPMLKSLLGKAGNVELSERDAKVAATVVQWMGSQVGFGFIASALAEAGYEITDTELGKRKT